MIFEFLLFLHIQPKFMKRLLLILFAFIFSITAWAETVKFMGQPLGCKYSVMKQHLLSKGFKEIGEVQPNVFDFTGRFGGDNVTISVFITPKSYLAHSVGVWYDDYAAYKSDKYQIDNLYKKNIF